MRKIILVFISILILFSCKKIVKPTLENINAIVDSNEYMIKIDIVGGSVAGSYTDQMIIGVNDDRLDAKSEFKNLSKKLNSIQKDSLRNILIRLAELHREEKIALKFGGCTARDQNYIIENDSIKMRIKPEFGNGIYHEILELIK
ncbi:hypothetical protein [Hyunsoonleella ulvae]|uniref:hypothetical protein n=1 Tax=Hyunsoonleella ulvae TaxID=2799948 RepID=UPI001939517D|nr:hypothetical protein [Hyunsoonleella ulvae]